MHEGVCRIHSEEELRECLEQTGFDNALMATATTSAVKAVDRPASKELVGSCSSANGHTDPEQGGSTSSMDDTPHIEKGERGKTWWPKSPSMSRAQSMDRF